MQTEVSATSLDGKNSLRHRWGVILAGGDGKRLLPLTRRITGDDRPKQFCAVVGHETLLQQTRRRISGLIPERRTMLMLTKTHQPFYADQIAGIQSARLLIQPSNQGTAPAILYSLLRLRKMDPEGVVAYFPSDHYFSNQDAFIRHLNSAYEVAASRPDVVLLLGIPPETPEVEYGWIEPGLPLGTRADSVFRVSRFWEKPDQALAKTLMEGGCLWNSFIMVGHVNAFLNIVQQTLPRLVEAFESIRSFVSASFQKAQVCELYTRIDTTSFALDVLSLKPNALAVIRADGLGWSDLGEPGRVLSIRERKSVESEGRATEDYEADTAAGGEKAWTRAGA